MELNMRVTVSPCRSLPRTPAMGKQRWIRKGRSQGPTDTSCSLFMHPLVQGKLFYSARLQCHIQPVQPGKMQEESLDQTYSPVQCLETVKEVGNGEKRENSTEVPINTQDKHSALHPLRLGEWKWKWQCPSPMVTTWIPWMQEASAHEKFWAYSFF